MAIVTCPQCGAKNRVQDRGDTVQPVCGRCGTKLEIPAQTQTPAGVQLFTDANFSDVVLGARGKPVLVDCWAPWCGPCRMIGPTVDQLAAESNGRWVIGKLNVDENPRIASQYQISSIPALFIFKDGQLIDRLVGAQPKPVIEQRLMAAVGSGAGRYSGASS